LTGGIKALANARKVKIVSGYANFISPQQVKIESTNEVIEFEHCIIAAGSRVTKIPSFPFDDDRVMDSTDALELNEIPERLLIVGGGIIGLEMATVYQALGSEITIVELAEQIIPSADKDIVMPLFKRIKKTYKNIYLNTKGYKNGCTQEGNKG
jgi:dihydrolipoamide dehydrogenase